MTRSAVLLIGALGLVLSVLGPIAAAGQVASGAQEPAELPLVAFRLSDGMTVTLDGRVDEPWWSQATPITDFTQQEPVEGDEPSEQTEIRVAYDADNLYIAAVLYDDPAGILAHQRERDATLSTDDRFQWILDTFRDGRTGYFFEINPAGLMGDGLLTAGGGGGGGGPGRGGGGFSGGRGGSFGGGSSKAWDGIWEARTAIRGDGWSAEIRIPFRTLNFDPSNDEWGINFQRTIRRRNEEILWRGHRRNQGLQSPIFAGRLQGLSGMSQGLGLEAVPSAVSSWRRTPCGTAGGCAPDYDANTFPYDVALDLNYSLTSSLRASASVNTDFAEVESDQRQVNLTRFALRFPEQRDFFLEGSGTFSFSQNSGPSPFYSRHVGLNEASGQQIPIQYGTRLTGQAGSYELGFYQIGTERLTYFDASNSIDVTVPAENFTVARVKRRIFEQSSIGVIYTRRSEAPHDSLFSTGHTAGVDLDLSTRNFLGDNNLQLEAFLAWNSDLEGGGDGFTESFGRLSSRGLRLNLPNDPWSGAISYREFGEGYDPSLGFVTRNNFRRLEPQLQWSPRPAGIPWIRNFNFGSSFLNQWQLDSGQLEERRLQLNLFGVNFESSDGFDFSATRAREYLDRNFTIPGGFPILVGDYTWWEYQIFGRTASQRPVQIFGGFTWGGFWDGNRRSLFSRLTFRPNPGVSLATNLQINDVSMPAGDFTASVYGLDAEWNPSPWISFTNQLQYDDVTELVGLFARMRWIVRPGNDVYFVYTHNWQNSGESLLRDPWLRTISNGASIKLNYTYRF